MTHLQSKFSMVQKHLNFFSFKLQTSQFLAFKVSVSFALQRFPLCDEPD